MKTWTYNREIQILIEQFTSAFNDIIIKRFPKDGKIPQSQFKVNFVYAPKQRVVETLKKPAPGGLTVPAVAINISSISRDQNRVFNKNTGFNIDALSITGTDRDFIKNIRQPVPVNIGINMTILTKYQTDLDQIISNFVPYCDPYIIISWKMPVSYGKDYEIRSEVLWSGNLNIQYPTDLGGNQSFRITADTSFIIKGWLFKSVEYNESFKKIYYINTDFVPVNEQDLIDDDLITNLDEYETDTVSISARPQLLFATPTAFRQQTSFWKTSSDEFDLDSFTVMGKMLSYTSAVYLSASQTDIFPFPPVYINNFSERPNLSAHYPSFYGYPLSSFKIIGDEIVTFNLPFSAQKTGFLDIIIENEAGYGSLIKDITHKFMIHEWKTNLDLMSGIKIFNL